TRDRRWTPLLTRARSRTFNAAGAAAVAMGLLGGTIMVVGGTSRAAPAAAAPGDPLSGRIAYAGTAHRSLGEVVDPVPDPGQSAQTVPLFGPGPAHSDDDVSAHGDVVVFTSRRDGPRPQVYLRSPDGAVRQLTTDRDAAHPQLCPDGQT